MAFVPIDRDTVYPPPQSVQAWLPETRLARHVVDVVEGLDLSAWGNRQGIMRPFAKNHPASMIFGATSQICPVCRVISPTGSWLMQTRCRHSTYTNMPI